MGFYHINFLNWDFRNLVHGENWDFRFHQDPKLGFQGAAGETAPHLKLGFWDFTLSEIGILGFQDPLFQDPTNEQSSAGSLFRKGNANCIFFTLNSLVFIYIGHLVIQNLIGNRSLSFQCTVSVRQDTHTSRMDGQYSVHRFASALNEPFRKNKCRFLSSYGKFASTQRLIHWKIIRKCSVYSVYSGVSMHENKKVSA